MDTDGHGIGQQESVNSASFRTESLPGLRPTERFKFAFQGDKVHVLANLRRAVEDAGLPAHEQRLDAIGLESQKDLSDRGRDQGCLP